MKYFERLQQVLEVGGDRPALQFAGTWWMWGHLSSGAAALAHALGQTKTSKRVPVAIVVRNRPASVSALLSLGAARRCALIVSPIQSPAALGRDVIKLQAGVVVAESEDWTNELAEAVKTMGAAGIELRTTGHIISARLRERSDGAAPEPTLIDAETDGIVIPTSGTTGPPKRIPLSWSHLDTFVPAASGEINWQRQRAVIVAAPLVTITGLRPLLTWATRPLKLALMERLEVRRWAELVREHKPKIAGLPPAAMRMMLDADIPPEPLSSIEGWHTGSAPLDPGLAEAFERRFKIPVLSAYGATEFGGPVAGWSAEDHRRFAADKRGSSGRFYEGCEGRIVAAESGAELPADTPGVLEVKSPTALVPTERGWIRTNDLARIDADGFLFILGRTDDVIVRGGFKVPLFELERALQEHPSVSHAAAVGLPDERLGQLPAAAVVLRPEALCTEQELLAWLRDRMAPYKIPVLISLVNQLPLNASMKVAKATLREQLAQEVSARISQ